MNSAPAEIARTEHGIHCRGDWTVRNLDGLEGAMAGLSWPGEREMIWELGGISAMDTAGAWLLQRTLDRLRREGRRIGLQGPTPEASRLLEIVSRYRKAPPPAGAVAAQGSLASIGRRAYGLRGEVLIALAFLGEVAVASRRLLAHPRSIRWRSVLGNIQLDGFNALGITGLLCFLMGIVIAYQGAEQLKIVGANIFIVDLTGIAMLREIAPLVTAIIVAGRSGSAFTAQIGAMTVTEELDAVRTLGISPMALLVIPRLLSLVVVLPLLTVFADAAGVFGGMLIASGSLGVSFTEFLSRFSHAVALKHYLIGVGKAPVFAGIVATVACYEGFRIQGGVESVGRRTTASVVDSIFLVIVFDAFFSVLFSWWGV